MAKKIKSVCLTLLSHLKPPATYPQKQLTPTTAAGLTPKSTKS